MDLFGLLIAIIVVGLIFYLFWWLLGVIALPDPFNKVAQVILALVAVIFLIGLLTGSVSMPVLRLR